MYENYIYELLTHDIGKPKNVLSNESIMNNNVVSLQISLTKDEGRII